MRIRTVKPAFFKDEELAELPPITRLLFQGLWLMADRDGRLEDRPRFIKVEVLPYDDCDVEPMLAALNDKKFILRYEVADRKCIHISGFTTHQRITGSEADYPSELPPPPGLELFPVETTRQQLGNNSDDRKGKGVREREIERGKGKGKEKQEPVAIPEDLQTNQDAILAWLAYKKERGQGYKGQVGLRALWGRLRAIPQDKRVEAINASMGNGWAGIFEPKGGNYGGQKTGGGGGLGVESPTASARRDELRSLSKPV
jgi:hypothetical protein